ncbi:MAG TPA: hypothetical protein VGE96_00935 [Steroidobacteraceae bacterium]|jgi:hypothetical protein
MATGGKESDTSGPAPHAPRSLRDHFASTALAGMEITAQEEGTEHFYYTAGEIAKRAYAIADAMLRERAK